MDALDRRALRGSIIGNAVFFALIFGPAGTLNYWQGWAFFLTLALSTALVTLYMARHDRQLLERRLRMGPKAEKTQVQKIILGVSAAVYPIAFIIMVLDHRFGWSPAVPAWLSLVCDGLGALGLYIYFLVVRENRYAAATVEVREGQTVVSTGPYAIVRHPMYSGAILVLLAAPVALGSWWGLIFTPVFVLSFAWRLLNEERYLAENLPGYTQYIRKMRYRLLPYLW